MTTVSHLFEGDLGCVDNVAAPSLVLRVLFVPEDEGDVGRGVVGCLVSLSGEGDLGPGLPALLYHHIQHLVFGSHRAAVRVESTAGDLDVLGAALHHVIQAHRQVVHHGIALQTPLTSSQAALVAGEASQVAERELSERVEKIFLAVEVAAEEDVKVVGAVEGGEVGMGIAVGIVAENVGLTCQCYSTLKACKHKKIRRLCYCCSQPPIINRLNNSAAPKWRNT